MAMGPAPCNLEPPGTARLRADGRARVLPMALLRPIRKCRFPSIAARTTRAVLHRRGAIVARLGAGRESSEPPDARSPSSVRSVLNARTPEGVLPSFQDVCGSGNYAALRRTPSSRSGPSSVPSSQAVLIRASRACGT